MEKKKKKKREIEDKARRWQERDDRIKGTDADKGTVETWACEEKQQK